MLTIVSQPPFIKSPLLNHHKFRNPYSSYRKYFRIYAVSSMNGAFDILPASPSFLAEGSWKEVSGGVTAPIGFKAAGIYSGLRAKGETPDLALVTCDVDSISAGVFTTNVASAAPVNYCRHVLDVSKISRAILINAGQANAATGDAGYGDVIDCANAVADLLYVRPDEVLIESTGVIGERIKKSDILRSLPKLVDSLSATTDGAISAAVAITTTDLVTKTVAAELKIGEATVRIGGMAKGSGMIHPDMATMLSVITTDASLTSEVWRKMVRVAVNQSFNQITVDACTSTNDAVIALASGQSGAKRIASLNTDDAEKFQACLNAVMVALAKSIAWDGEGATCLIEVQVSGADSDAKANMVARSVASSSLCKAAVFGRDPNWGRIACAVGSAGVRFESKNLCISLGDIVLMKAGQPLPFDRVMASEYLKMAGERHGSIEICICIGGGAGRGVAWGCDLSYDYVRINAEYTS